MSIGLYECGQEQVKIRKKKWNNKEIDMLLKINMQTESKEKGGGNSVPLSACGRHM